MEHYKFPGTAAKIMACGILAVTAALQPAHADDGSDAFVEANILSVFYHELGHAVIDLMEVPVYGQEEDAADVMAVLLIDRLFEEEAAQSVAYDSAFGFINDPDGKEEIAWWDLHGPDEQRFYNHVCLFYGGNPDARADVAADLGLPVGRAETCEEEYDLAADSWGAVFDRMRAAETDGSLRFQAGKGADSTLANQVLGEEIALMNTEFALPYPVTVRVADCGEANAFYDPGDTSITFCTEFIPHLEQLYRQSLQP